MVFLTLSNDVYIINNIIISYTFIGYVYIITYILCMRTNKVQVIYHIRAREGRSRRYIGTYIYIYYILPEVYTSHRKRVTLYTYGYNMYL